MYKEQDLLREITLLQYLVCGISLYCYSVLPGKNLGISQSSAVIKCISELLASLENECSNKWLKSCQIYRAKCGY